MSRSEIAGVQDSRTGVVEVEGKEQKVTPRFIRHHDLPTPYTFSTDSPRSTSHSTLEFTIFLDTTLQATDRSVLLVIVWIALRRSRKAGFITEPLREEFSQWSGKDSGQACSGGHELSLDAKGSVATTPRFMRVESGSLGSEPARGVLLYCWVCTPVPRALDHAVVMTYDRFMTRLMGGLGSCVAAKTRSSLGG